MRARRSIRVGADPYFEAVEAGDATEAGADLDDLDCLEHVGELDRGRRQLAQGVGEGLVEGELV